MNLLRKQWAEYPITHHDRLNLVIHLVTVPLFWFGLLFLVGGGAPWLSPGSGWLRGAGLGLIGLALAAQGRGHAHEQNKPAPFASPHEFILRLLAEQLVTFPRFALSGELSRALRGPSSAGPSRNARARS